jgi:hypothetical protein
MAKTSKKKRKEKMIFIGVARQSDNSLSIFGKSKKGMIEFTDCQIVSVKRRVPKPKGAKPIKKNGSIVGYTFKIKPRKLKF